MKARIKALADQHLAEITDIRRHLHMHPELSFEEIETGAYIAKTLERFGIPHKTGVAGHGVVGYIETGRLGRTIALRADIDALPIQEINKVDYISQNPGVMHACGHDVHSSSLLGTALILDAIKAEMSGRVILLWQPAEEKIPGGAIKVIEEGWLDDAEIVLGQHVHPPLHTGRLGLRAGPYMASADEIYVTVKGKGGHGALPQDCIDPIVVTAHLITALQQIVSRYADPTVPSVLTFGKIWSDGGATNIIPNQIFLEGTFRTMDEAWRSKSHELMVNMAEHLCISMGATCDFKILRGYPFLVNEPELTAEVFADLREFLGEEMVDELPIRMTAEDFAYYSQIKPTCFYRLGVGNPAKGIGSPLHTNTFNIDESSLATGMGSMAWLAYKALTSK
ncbi:MAG: amidohydrolase [Saprospiraceae bacterium]